MGRKTDWASFNKQARSIKSTIKASGQAGDFFKNFPGPGEMRDNISKNIVKISECKSSSLRRYIKLLEKYYYLPLSSEKEKEQILNKKIEIENELATRPDALVEDKPKKKGRPRKAG